MTSSMHSGYSTTSEGACSLEERERTAHGTQAAGDFGAEAAAIKAMIDFFPRSFFVRFYFSSHSGVLLWICLKCRGPLLDNC